MVNLEALHVHAICHLLQLLHLLNLLSILVYFCICSIGFRRADNSFFIYHHGFETIYLFLYVDDIILTTSLTTRLSSEFSMKDLRPHFFLGIDASWTAKGPFLSQTDFAEKTKNLTCVDTSTSNPCDIVTNTKSKLSLDGKHMADPTLHRSHASGLQ